MTKLSMYQQQESRGDMEINRSSRRDYLWRNVLRSLVCYTISIVLIAVMIILCLLLQQGAWNIDQILLYGVIGVVVYVAGGVLFGLGTFIHADNQYRHAAEGIRQYEIMLKRLQWMYEREERK